MGAKPVLTLEQIAEGLRDAPAATRDDVPVALDGRRLDSPDKVLAWLAEVNAVVRRTSVPESPDEAAPPQLDVAAIVGALGQRDVEYLLVGGVAAQAYGATRPTQDFDCLVRRDKENFERLSAAMRDLGARLRVEGLSDDEARALPVQVDGRMLAASELSTWRTDAGDFDVLTNLPGRNGERLGYEDLETRADLVHGFGFTIRAAGLGDIIASKEWANRQKDHSALPELYKIAAGEVGEPGT